MIVKGLINLIPFMPFENNKGNWKTLVGKHVGRSCKECTSFVPFETRQMKWNTNYSYIHFRLLTLHDVHIY